MNRDVFSVDGKVVIVTGGGTGIGAEIAREFAGRGAKVLIASRNAEHLGPVAEGIRADGGVVESITCDVRDPSQVERMVERAYEKFGGLDVLINNHGASFFQPAEEISPNGFATIVAINLQGTFLCSKAAALKWIAAKHHGRIINMSSDAGVYGAPGMSHYGAAKAGVQNLTRTLAMEWARHGILVNCIAPGPIDTPEAGARTWPTPELRRTIEHSTALRRLGRVEEIAWPCVFFASDASSFVTGQTISIDGGPSSLLFVQQHE
ncbi:MAG: glucose 1-dehydrogenase [Deltaproteobacteria bacterium]|nr:MAG: glucose 1-dehydrogenase [Deltaproteobacteria bacterium]